MNFTKEQFYKRQTLVQEFGASGQQKLQDAKVVIIGCGGLGNTVAAYLTSSGIGALHLIDFDQIDITNLHRQVFFKPMDIGKNKSEILAKQLQQNNPFVRVSFANLTISKSNIATHLMAFDYIVDCTDSLPIKYLLNDFCVLYDKPLVYGSLHKFDGYVASFNILQKEGSRSANLRDAFPKIPKKGMPNCAEVGTLNPIVGIVGLLQANEVIKLVSGIGKPIQNQILIYNSLENSQYKMQLQPNFNKAKIQLIFEKEHYQDPSCTYQKEELLISAKALQEDLLHNKSKLKIISVIEDVQTKIPFEADYKIPLSQLKLDSLKFDKNKIYIVVCNKGISSYIATEKIKNTFPDLKILSLENGITQY